MLKNYLLTAWNVLMRRKLFTAINLVCVVLTLVVLMVFTALLESAFYPSGVEGKSDRMLQVITIAASGPHTSTTSPLGYKVVEQYLKPMKSLERVAATTLARAVSVYQGATVSELMMRRTDADYWKVLDFTVLAGRVLNDDDLAQGRFVAVINASSARRLFPAGAALGQKINVAGQLFEVCGVVEDALQVNAYADIWAPITTLPSSAYRQQFSGEFTAILLARSAADLPQIRREVAAIAKSVVFDDPQTLNRAVFWADSKLDLFARLSVGDTDVPDSGAATVLALIGAAMLLFMLLPALNLVNLNTGRIAERSAEIGVRKAFGATSAQLMVQLVIENVVLCLAGGLIGLACTAGVLWWLEGSGLIPYLKIHLNFTVFCYGLVITLVFGVLSGVLPAWKMARLDPVHALKGAA
ncbi:MAG: ABC transporter permease [Pseudomonadota bacterium]|nr:ABC transporter permease [Pseudomonadota bacterium]